MSDGFPYVAILWLLSVVAFAYAMYRAGQQTLHHRREQQPAERQICGGCRGMGAHRRWCVRVVGLSASIRGRQAEMAENLADSVGSNNPAASNHLYAASGLLRAQAEQAKRVFQRQHER